MRGFKKCVSAMTAAAMLFTSVLPAGGLSLTAYAAGRDGDAVAVDTSVRLLPSQVSPFNDTDGDGLGEFQGWGTSLCWWANRLGYSESMTNQAAEAFFGDNGLDMNIGRYNIGGGDNVGDVTEVPVNERAQFYDLETEGRTPTYAGSKMKISDEGRLKDKTFSVSDADFGFTKGQKIGEFKNIGWINKLGDAVGDGDNLSYTVNVAEAGNYTVKLLMFHNGNSKRDVAIRVNDDAENGTYVVDNATIQNSKLLAESGDAMTLYSIAISNVALQAGDNNVKIAGQADWTLDFVKMAVIKAGDEGVLPSEDFLHAPHITRSDSAIPGYWKDVTKIVLTEDRPIEWWQQNYARADQECGYAWNYDWEKDKNQMNILRAAKQASGEDFIAEAFSNSPPYFMTVSGCSSGNADASKDNLRADSYKAFGAYMADVITHWAEEGVVNFQSATPMNEPYTNYWGANSFKQEGCHFDQGNSESKAIEEFYAAMQGNIAKMAEGPAKEAMKNLVYSGTDETSIDTAITSYNQLSSAAKNIITRIDTHTYSGSKREELSALAEKEKKNLWMSEIDGASEAGTDAGEMTAALGFAGQIMRDVNGLRCSAWIMWNAVDLNVDKNNEFDADTIEDLLTKLNDSNEVMYNPVKGFWGIAIGDHNNQELVLTKKYEALGQFTRYIRPGYAIMGSDNSNTLVAYDPDSNKAVIVVRNTAGEDKTWNFDLSDFKSMGSQIHAYRTSGSKESGEKWADVSASDNIVADTEAKSFTATLKANSVTTYEVEGVVYDKDYAEQKAFEEELKTELMKDAVEKVALDSSMVTGSEPWNGDQANGVQNVVDGNYSTFFDGVTKGWVQIDLGKEVNIGAFGYAPRSGFNGRCVGASFYGSNDKENWTLLYTITESPAAGQATNVYVSQFKTDAANFRYVKYAVPEDDSAANCNIAEIEVYQMKEGFEMPETLQDWIGYYEGKTEGHTYSEATQEAYNTALAAARALVSSTDEEAKTVARNNLVKAYRALKEVFNYTNFSGVDGGVRTDNNGEVIQAHGGQIQQITSYDLNGDGQVTKDDAFWYWIGEDKTNDYRPCPGIHVYISKDLYNWEDKGCVLRTVPNWETFTTDKYFTDLYGDMPEDQKEAVYGDLWTADNSSNGGCVIERPKMIYNDTTKKYVIWFHADGQIPGSTGSNYAKAKAGVAVSDSPFGPFQLQGSYLLNYEEGADHGFDEEVGGHVRDMNLFKDDDGTGYVIYSSDGNQTMHVAKLNAEYTNVAQPDNSKAEQGVGKDFTRNFIGESREAPAMFKYNNKYYIITSGCTGWSPNRASYAVADHPMGPWTTMGDPCTDSGSATTYDTQSTCVFPVDAAKGQFIYMGDRWRNPDNGGSLRDSRYVWIPVEFISGNKIALRRYSDWDLSVFDDIKPFEIKTKIPETAASVAALKAALPDKVTIQYVGETTEQEVAVTWSGLPADSDNKLGTVNVTGELANGRTFTQSVGLFSDKMIYFFDSYANGSESAYLNQVKSVLKEKLRNTAADQAYSAENKAGYTGEFDVDFGGKSEGTDIWSRGYWAKSGKNIDYAFDLEAGKYTVSTGYQEWWNTSRPTKVTVTSENGGELATHTFTLANTATSQQENVSFTLDYNEKVTVSVSKTGGADPVLSWIALMQEEKFTEKSNKEQLNAAVSQAEQVEDAGYTKASWAAFSKALADAKKLQVKVTAEQSEVDAAVKDLTDAKAALKTVKAYLEEGIAANTVADSEKDKYTADSWDAYQAKLKAAKDLVAKEGLTEAEADSALKDLSDAKAALTSVDKSQLNAAIDKAKALKEADYTKVSWSTFQEALTKAQEVQASTTASQDAVDSAKAALDQAISGLKTLKSVLEAGIAANTIADSEKDKYTAESWNFYQSMLKEAKDLLAKGTVAETDVNSAVKALQDAKSNLEKKPVTPPVKKNQKIKYTKSFEKAYGDKAFKLGAKVTTGNGKLSYKTSDKKVAVVDKNGKVTVKGIGKCTITITAAATSTYNKKSVSVALKVNPKKAALSSVKAVKGKKLTVKWKRDSKVTGYQIQYSLKKNFSGAGKITVKKNKTTSTTIKKLKAGKKYYVKIRAYKTVKVGKKSQNFYGDWSNAKLSAKIKK